MLPPPDGSGPHAGENRSFRLRTDHGVSLDRRHRGARFGPDHRRRGGPSAGRDRGAQRHASGRRRPTSRMQIEGRFAAPKATPLDLAGTAGSFDGWMRGLPGNIDLQGGFGGGKIAIKGGVGVKGTTVQINSEGPDVSVFGPYIRLPVPAGGPYALSAKAATQRSAFKVDVTTLKVGLERAHGRCPVPRRPQRHGDHHRQCRCEPSRYRRSARGAGRRGCRPAPRRPPSRASCRPCRFRRAGSAARPCR